MFPDTGKSFDGLKHLTEKTTVLASLTHVWVVDTAQPIAKISKVKDLALILLISVCYLAYQLFNFCQKSISSIIFYTFFTHPQPFNEMFSFSSKSCC